MKKMMKKLLLLTMVAALAICAVFSMTACGNKKVKIGVQSGTTGGFYVMGNPDMLLPGFKNLECNGFDNAGLAVTAMKNKQVDYVIIDNGPASELVKKIDGIKMIDIALTTEEYAFGVDKAQGELLTKINAFIGKIKADGTLEGLFDKYGKLEYDEEGNVVGGDVDIAGVTSAAFDANKKDTQLVVATNAAFAPYEYKKGDKFVGIDMEIADLLAKELGLELVIQDMEFDAVCTSVGKNGVDMAMAGLSVTATRKQTVNFSDAYFKGAYQVLVVKSDDTTFDKCKTKEDIEEILKNK